MKKTSVPGELELDILFRSMEPVLQEDVFVFVTVNESFNTASLSPIMTFRESEGTTMILSRDTAEKEKLNYEFPCRMITLNVHSALEAVGFLARITQRLAALNMGVNPVAAFYHDHLFIPADRADDALTELRNISNESRQGHNS